MSNLSLGPVIGTLGGGAEVNTIPVDFVSSSGTGVKHVADVPIPAGVTAQVVVVGVSAATQVASYGRPAMRIGGETAGYSVQAFAMERVVTGPVAVEVNRQSNIAPGDPSFVGTVFWWEVSDE